MTATLIEKNKDWLNGTASFSGPVIAGVDEAGRGPLAGPVVTAAVVLDPRRAIQGLGDSKALSARKRDALALEIREKAWVGIGIAEPEEIDRLNILHATMAAMVCRRGDESGPASGPTKIQFNPAILPTTWQRCHGVGNPSCR